jgi:hypothetical protein
MSAIYSMGRGSLWSPNPALSRRTFARLAALQQCALPGLIQSQVQRKLP